ncbi:MAG: selenide, water dikinase SelD [Pseudomonadota bacterium]
MHSVTPALRDLVLVGGGHANVTVLKKFAMRPVPGLRITVISKDTHTPYSGMLPGTVAGVYAPSEMLINLRRLCRLANARLIHGAVVGLDATNQCLQIELSGGLARPPLPYDLVAINSGAVPAAPVPGAVMVKPISEFLPKWQRIVETIQDGDTLTVIGGGAGGVELALAARARFTELGLGGVCVQLLGSDLLPGHNARVRQLILQALGEAHIEWHLGRAQRFDDGHVRLTDNSTLASDHTLWVTNVEAPAWIRDSGLPVDGKGFLRVNRQLQSLAAAQVFAAGDVAALEGQPRPKSGVYAVRAGPYLAHNLRAYLYGRTLRTYRAQREHLALIGTGDGRAIASRGRQGFVGANWWRLKDRIDRRFMAKFNAVPLEMSSLQQLRSDLRGLLPGDGIPPAWKPELPNTDMRCGGCGAKLAASPLRRVLARLSVREDTRVELGIGDDAASVRHDGPTLLSVDGFRAMVDDPYLFGRIATHHALNDIYAMAANPVSALCFVTLPYMGEQIMEEELYAILSGVGDVLDGEQVALVGGHSAEGAELSIALTVTGERPSPPVGKEGARVGDVLLLTKPLGTGAILAADMLGANLPGALQAVYAGMDRSNAQVVARLQQFDLHALTDITGFGLAGHLGEVLRASSRGVRLALDAVPLYPGAEHAISAHPSSLQQANELALQDYVLQGGVRSDDARLRLLCDPQTSGGMLAVLPTQQAQAAARALSDIGHGAAIIGEVVGSGWQISAREGGS